MKNLITLALVLLVLNANGQEPPVEPTRQEQATALRTRIRLMQEAQRGFGADLQIMRQNLRQQEQIARQRMEATPFVTVQRAEVARIQRLRQAVAEEEARHEARAAAIRESRGELRELSPPRPSVRR
jgi:septal ring factor EnvC (AmiA/AmiB activator)